MAPIGPPPDEWDPNSVKLTLQPHFSGAETEKERLEIIKLHKWKYAAGDITKKTEKKAAQAHSNARAKVWDIVMANRARGFDKDKRTDEQKEAIQKVENRGAYNMSRKGNSGVIPMIPPPAKWRPDLVGEARTGESWKYAAGLNDDKSAKNVMAHSKARARIIRNFRLEEANEKDPCDRNDEDLKVIAADVVHKEKRVNRNNAKNKEKQKAQQHVCNKYLENHPELLVATYKPLTEQDAFDIVFKLFDDKDSELFDKLGSKTLRQAMYGENSSTAIYIGAGRGFGEESFRFTVRNTQAATTTLTRMDNTNFKARDQEFKDLNFVSVPVGHFTSWSDCTAVEAALQLILDDLEIGRQRLWSQSGIGRYRRQLRTYDKRHIEKLKDGEDKNLTFVCFITILRNVEVLSRCTDAITGKNVVKSIKAGSGTECSVHQPKSKPISDPAQKAALEATRMKLGLNWMDGNHKRKLDDFLSAESEDGEKECKDEQCSTDGEDDE